MATWKGIYTVTTSTNLAARHQRRIITTHNACLPFTSRFDWMAHYEGEEDFGEYGFGSSEAQAIADLAMSYPQEEL